MKDCELCGAMKFREVFKVGGRGLVECTQCSLVRTDKFKRPNYRQYHRDEDYASRETQFKNIFRKRFNLVGKYISKPGRVLDIGASTGLMLDIFRENGWETWGVEPSASFKVARMKGHRMVKARFEKAKVPVDYFEAVVLNHTLEHMNDPVGVMRKVRRGLRKGGIVLVDVPNFGAFSRKMLGAKWPYILPDEHLYQFTTKSLGKIFEKAGLRVCGWESRSGLFEYASPVGELWLSLVTLKKRFIMDLFGFPGAVVSTLLNQGTSFSMVGKK